MYLLQRRMELGRFRYQVFPNRHAVLKQRILSVETLNSLVVREKCVEFVIEISQGNLSADNPSHCSSVTMDRFKSFTTSFITLANVVRYESFPCTYFFFLCFSSVAARDGAESKCGVIKLWYDVCRTLSVSN